VLQRKNYSLFVICGDIMILVKVIDDERKRRRVGQHEGYRCPTCAKKGKMQVESRFKHEVSPSTTDLYQAVPPPFALPFPLCEDLHIVGLAFIQNHWPTER
jgi:hypothetical protein